MYPPDLIDLLLQHTRHSSTKIAELGHFLIENAVNLCRKHELEEVEEDDSATLSSLSSPSLSPSPRSPPPPLLSSFKHFSSNPTLVLVGAGPGDPSLMTLAAVDCLRQATLIIKDGLIPPSFISEILGDHHYSTSSSSYSSKSHIHHHLNANEFFFSLTPTIKTVNKECGRAHTAQGEIHQWILEEVLKTSPSYTPFIVRLKGGDPFIFGRGGEEIQVLYSHLLDQYKRHRNHPSDDHVIDSYDYHCNFKESIEQLITSLRIKIIPGISSSLSAPLAALIPPTHRGTSDQIFISTGRKERDGVMPDYPKFSRNRTSIFLMAMTRFRYLVNDILHLSCEYPANLPVAVISKATWSRTTTTAAAPFIHDDDDGGFDNIFCNQEIREMEEGQRVIIGTVATIADLVEEAGIKNHATAVFGYSVTALRGGGDAIDDGGNLNGFEQETRWEEGGCIIEMKRNKKSIH